jgi:GNAT superfamily N-acetyltransferase
VGKVQHLQPTRRAAEAWIVDKIDAERKCSWNGLQVGFARVVTDHAVFAWIADVVIHPDQRGRGIGKFLMGCIQNHPEIPNSLQVLRTSDAHGLYEKFGFGVGEFMKK